MLEYEFAVAHIQVSWLSPNKVRRMTVVGSRKMVVYDDVAIQRRHSRRRHRSRAPRPHVQRLRQLRRVPPDPALRRPTRSTPAERRAARRRNAATSSTASSPATSRARTSKRPQTSSRSLRRLTSHANGGGRVELSTSPQALSRLPLVSLQAQYRTIAAEISSGDRTCARAAGLHQRTGDSGVRGRVRCCL